MKPRTRKWLWGCGAGCAGLGLVGAVVVIGGSALLMGKFREAIEVRRDLDAQHGDQASYVPPPDGAIAPDRIDAFLVVRAAVMGQCAGFAGTADQFARMEGLDDETSERQAVGEAFRLTGEVIRMVPRLGLFYHARNATLAEVGMGLGEYTYIYVMAYQDSVRSVGEEDVVFGESGLGDRVHRALRGMLEGQLAASPPGRAFRDTLRAELARLDADPERLPWQDGLPAGLAASLAPHREALGELFCPATVGLELNTNRQRGLSFISE